MHYIVHWIERHQLPCFYRKFLGIDCPGCGMQTALIELLKGNIVESIKVYPALIPTICMFIYLILHLIFKFKNGANFLKYCFIFTVVIIVINYVYKMIVNFNIKII